MSLFSRKGKAYTKTLNKILTHLQNNPLETPWPKDVESVIATLIVMGWKRCLSNYLIRPKDFEGGFDIGITDDGFFVFLDETPQLKNVGPLDTVTISLEKETHRFSGNGLLTYISDYAHQVKDSYEEKYNP